MFAQREKRLRTLRNIYICRSIYTSIDSKSLVVKEASLESILHLGSVNNVIFGLQCQLLQSRTCLQPSITALQGKGDRNGGDNQRSISAILGSSCTHLCLQSLLPCLQFSHSFRYVHLRSSVLFHLTHQVPLQDQKGVLKQNWL